MSDAFEKIFVKIPGTIVSYFRTPAYNTTTNAIRTEKFILLLFQWKYLRLNLNLSLSRMHCLEVNGSYSVVTKALGGKH